MSVRAATKRNINKIYTKVRTSKYGIDHIKFERTKLFNIPPKDLRETESLNIFKTTTYKQLLRERWMLLDK